MAFISVILMDNSVRYRAMIPKVEYHPTQKTAPPNWYYTHDSLQEAKDYCVAELVNRRLT